MAPLGSKHALRKLNRSFVNIGAPIAVALLLAGCSWVPDWANPVNAYDAIFGDNWVPDWANPVNAYGAVFGDDPPPPKLATEQDKKLAFKRKGSTFPNVGSVPYQAPKTSSAAERRRVVQGLVADKQNARYTDGSGSQQVASAPPPPPATSIPSTVTTAGVAQAVTQTPSGAPRLIAVPSIVQGGPQPIAPPQAGAPYPQIVVPATAAMVPQPAAQTALPQVAGPTTPVSVPLLQSTLTQNQVAVAPVTKILPGQFITVEQVFAARIAESGATVTAAPAHLGFQMAAQPVNTLALPAQSTAVSANLASTQPQLAVSMPAGLAAGEPIIVHFAHGSARITARELAKVGEIARRYKANGGGMIRVVGHSSSRTKNLPVGKHKLVNFWISIDRAQAVASELMRQGVSASVIVIEARSDIDPLVFESMPAGEAQNRRTEVYLEF